MELSHDNEAASEMSQSSVMFEYSSTEAAGQTAPPKKVKKAKPGYDGLSSAAIQRIHSLIDGFNFENRHDID